MSKNSHFSGQPIFSQIISLIPKEELMRLARQCGSDHYYKKFKTYEHLVTMLYAILSKCTSIREVTTGLMACGSKLNHLGMSYFPRRSTLSDANCHRKAKVFEQLYYYLYKRYRKYLPDSRTENWASRLYIFDATTISLFQQILQSVGPIPMNGKRKGGMKAHTLMKADEDVPCLVKFTAAASPDTPFMKEIHLCEGAVVVFDKGYNNYTQLARWSAQGVSFVSRLRKSASYRLQTEKTISQTQKAQGVRADQLVLLGHHSHNNITRLKARLVKYYDSASDREFTFVTNNFRFAPRTIADIYRRRWQIETLFKRIKQNYPIKYFLGDNANAIQIQIWCALIADLLLKYIGKQLKRKWAFANLSSMIRLHLMNYIHLQKFLNNPEKATIEAIKTQTTLPLFPT